MKGFKPTGYGPTKGFTFSSKHGFTGSTGSVTNVAGYTRRKGYASGGIVKEGYQPKVESVGDSGHATVRRNKPSTDLDQETGGKTPLRPGFKSGGKNWIAGAIKKPGALHKALGVPEGQNIPQKKLTKAANSNSPKMRQRAALAKTLGTMNKADGGKVEGVKAAAQSLYKIYSKTGDKLVGSAKTRNGATKVLDRKDNEYGGYNHYIIHPDGRRTSYGDGGKVGKIASLVKSVMGKAKKPVEAAAPRAPPTTAPVTEGQFGVLDRQTGAKTPYTYRALRDAAIERKNKLEGVQRYSPIDSSGGTAKRRGGAVKMTRC